MARNGTDQPNRTGRGAAPFDYEQELRRSAPRQQGSGMQMYSFHMPVGQGQAPAQQSVPRRQAPPSQPRRTGPAGAARGRQPQHSQARARQGSAQRPPQSGGERPRNTVRNPQQAGYRQGAPHKRRLTNSEKRRIRRNRAILGVVLVLIALLVGILLSINLLFKVTGFRVENPDKSTPADTGVYTEQQIIDQLGIQTGENLFGFSAAQKTRELSAAMPYLETAEVCISLPGTVVVKVKPATECFKLQLAAGWAVLSDRLKILQIQAEEPSGLILLQGSPAAGQSAAPGSVLELVAQQILAPDDAAATMENAQSSVNATLTALVAELDRQGLLADTTMLTITDLSEISFLYQGRISVQLGTANNLEYKLRLAAKAIYDPEQGLAQSDRGTLDVSIQRNDGDIYAYFLPAETQPTPAPQSDPQSTPGPEGGASE